MAVRGPMHTVHVPLQQPQTRWSLPLQLGEAQILHSRCVPGRIDHRVDAPKPALAKESAGATLIAGMAEGVCETLHLKSADRHALRVDRIEAAHGIAEHDQPLRKAPKLLVAASETSREPVMHNLRQGLARPDGFVNVGYSRLIPSPVDQNR